MTDESVQVKFGATTSELDSASARAKQDIQGVGDAGKDLGKTFGGLKSLINDALKLNLNVEGVRTFSREVTHTVDETFGLSEALGEIGAAVAAAFTVAKVYEWAEAMGEAYEHAEQLSQQLALSSEELSRWHNVMTLAGRDPAQFDGAVTRLYRSMVLAASGAKQQGAAFEALGVNIKSVHSTTQLLDQVTAKFASMEDGPKKVAIAMALMGRSGAAMIPIFDMGMGRIQEQFRLSDQAGATMTAAMTENGLKVAEAFDTMKVRAEGFALTMFNALAPAIATAVYGMADLYTKFMASYQAGGAAKLVVDLMVGSLKLLVSAASLASASISFIWETWKIVGDGMMGTFGALTASLTAMLRGMGAAIAAAARGDFQSAWQALQDGAKNTAQAWQSWMHAGALGIQRDFNAIVDAGKTFSSRMDELWAGNGPKLQERPKEPAGNFGDTDIPGFGGGEEKTRTSQWTAELQQRLEAEGNFFKSSTTDELAFWQAKLALTTSGSKEQQEVEAKIYSLRKQMAQDGLRAQLEDLQAQQDAARDDYAKKAALENQKLALIARTYGQDSAEYQRVLREKQQMDQQHADHLIEIERARIDTQSQINRAGAEADLQVQQSYFDAQRDQIDNLESLGVISKLDAERRKVAVLAQEQAAEQASANRIFDIQMEGYQKELAIQGLRPEARQEVLNRIAVLEAEHTGQMQELQARSAANMQRSQNAVMQASAARWQSVFDTISEAGSQMFQSLLQGSTTWKQALLQAGDQITSAFLNWALRSAGQWLATEATKTSATAAGAATRTAIERGAAATGKSLSIVTALHDIGIAASRAAANTYASVAAIPIVGPFLAPAAAAVAFAAVAAFSALPSFEIGAWEISRNMTANLHAGEMVVPASFARGLRESGRLPGTAGASGATTNQGGDTHFTYAPTIHAREPASLAKMLDREGQSMKSWLNRQHRNMAPGLLRGVV